MKKISVIIPVYNVEDYIDDCIQSVLMQKNINFEQDIEILLIDDGSTDKSGKICDKYEKRFSFVKVMHQSNRGQSSARNLGIRKSCGEYLIFIDSDDALIDDAFFSNMLGLIQNRKLDVLQFSATNFEGDSIPYQSFLYSDVCCFKNKYDSICSHNFNIAVWSKIIKSHIVKEHNIYFKEGVTGEDILWYLQLLPYLESVGEVDAKPYGYRIRGGSTTHRKKNFKTIVDTYEMLTLLAESFKENKDNGAEKVLGYLSYQFYILLACSSELTKSELKQIDSKLKSLNWITRYRFNAKTMCCKCVYGLCGFGLTRKILYSYIIKVRRE